MSEQAARDEQARILFMRGRTLYDEGQFVEAAQKFEEAYRLSGRGKLLYNISLAQRDAGNLERATETLRQYLKEEPNDPQRAKLQARLESMEQQLAERAATKNAAAKPAAKPAPATPTSAPRAATPGPARVAAAQPAPVTPVEKATANEPQTATTADEASASDSGGGASIWPWFALGGGGALIAGSVVVGLIAKGKESDLQSSCNGDVCPADLKSTADSGKSLALVSDIMLIGGIAAAATGTVFLFLNRSSDEGESAQTAKKSSNLAGASLGCTAQGCIANLRGSF